MTIIPRGQAVEGHAHYVSEKVRCVGLLPRCLNGIHHQPFVKIVDRISQRHGFRLLNSSAVSNTIEVTSLVVMVDEQFRQCDWQPASLPPAAATGYGCVIGKSLPKTI